MRQEEEMVRASEERTRILKERARALARPREEADDTDDRLTVVEFMLAHERYAIELAHIREVYPLKDITPLPGVPDFVMGIVNVRGRILSLIDIRTFFELPAKGLNGRNQAIILQSGDMTFGLLADEILGTRSISQRDIQPSLPTLTGARAVYLKGVTNDGVTILDSAKILSDEKMVVQ